MEVTMKELTKERLAIRKTNPVRSNVLLMLVNAVKNITIEERREETPADFAKAAKKMQSELLSTIEEYKKGGADTSELEQELKELTPFLPTMLSPEAMEAEARKIIDALPAEEKNLKNIMPKLKAIEGFDMKAAKSIVEKILG
ncbi:MAG: GatB/YqeY domain-containing protein [Spirochaetaceae bacterium]|nr:GatB/YqeY domain-containing protein [Spirochaetaceae bacterium]